ncbi:Hypothetical protein NTJ_11610 [Nesidiocoris tenuis]|uniref:Reverse transcriptase domain-containing protein n=1 Tax=Nesidiocoris tenuis TaxID=355587 RepID=A0ABN7B316_9HEMI|nr:Hypothetical protein NTJ_11610 [Nesidiocoris tenuis]
MMKANGIISKVEEAPEWCSSIVVVPKKNGAIRMCGDFTELNHSIVRERLFLPSSEETLANIGDAKVFSKLDARMGFWQVPLSENSRKLTTFITPFGRFCFNRMPFGISSAPEHYQRRVAQVLEGLTGCVNMMDDVLIWGRTVEEHDSRLKRVLTKFKDANITLNFEKCEFRKSSIKFLGHLLSDNGISIDPDKVNAVLNMTAPTNKSEVHSVLGMFNYLTKFIPSAADLLYQLLVSIKNKPFNLETLP